MADDAYLDGIDMADETQEWQTEGDDDESRTVRARVEGAIRDVFKRTVNQSSGARAITEELIRAIANEMKLPREVAAYLLTNADNVKNEVVRVIATEVRRFLESANLGDEMARILTSISFEIRTEIRFIPNEDALKPNVRSRVGIKSTRSDEVIHEGESDEFDQALRAGLTEFLQRTFSRNSREGARRRGERARADEDVASADLTGGEDESHATGRPQTREVGSMQTSAERRQQLQKALAKRRDRFDR